jgi:uncharacterized membrane protein
MTKRRPTKLEITMPVSWASTILLWAGFMMLSLLRMKTIDSNAIDIAGLSRQ